MALKVVSLKELRLQVLLERFRCYYDEQRPHQGIADQTPAERYSAGFAELAPASASEGEPSYPPRVIVRKVASNGVFCYRNVHINIGLRYAGARVRIIQRGELVHVHYGSELVRSLAPDPAQRYQRKERARRTPHSQP